MAQAGLPKDNSVETFYSRAAYQAMSFSRDLRARAFFEPFTSYAAGHAFPAWRYIYVGVGGEDMPCN